jgi:hypothetical protein
MNTKIKDDFEFYVTRDRLADLRSAREGYRTHLTPGQFAQTEPGLSYWIAKMEGEIEEYLAVYGDPATRNSRAEVTSDE